jgi:glutathione synthase/RimK-type ligase-like ATP-grasp enzyme
MLLILSNSKDVTSDYLAGLLQQHDVPFLRLDTDRVLSQAIVGYVAGQPTLRFASAEYAPAQISHLWYRRPERLRHPDLDDSPESKFVLEEWAEALEGFLAHIDERLWVNHPSRNVRASHKLEQLSRAKSVGLAIPNTLVTQDADHLREFHAMHRGRVIVKPMATGYIERLDEGRDSLIYTNRVQLSDLESLDTLHGCPTLFQELVDKRCDVRITVLDDDFHSVELAARDSDGTQRCDIRRNNMDDVAYRPIRLPIEIREHLKNLLRQYELRFAAIDMAVTTKGEWVFFEVNPNGQWAWLDLAGVTNIAASFIDRFSAAVSQ